MRIRVAARAHAALLVTPAKPPCAGWSSAVGTLTPCGGVLQRRRSMAGRLSCIEQMHADLTLLCMCSMSLAYLAELPHCARGACAQGLLLSKCPRCAHIAAHLLVTGFCVLWLGSASAPPCITTAPFTLALLPLHSRPQCVFAESHIRSVEPFDSLGATLRLLGACPASSYVLC